MAGAENVGDFCVINVDYGIGSAFIINGQIYRGALFGSGQIGHTIINPDGSACACGRYGCLETVASLSAIKKRARVFLKQQGRIPLRWRRGVSAQPSCWHVTIRGIP